MFESVTLKVGTMRKPKSFVTYAKSGDEIKVQADGCIGSLNVATGEFVFTNKGKYFSHLSLLGKSVEITPEQKQVIIDAEAKLASRKVDLGDGSSGVRLF